MNRDDDIWNAYVTSYRSYLEASHQFLTGDHDRVAILKKAFRSSDRYFAITLLKFLQQEELQQLFEDLVFLASFAHGSVDYVREIIHKLPKEWVISRIEQIAEPLLENGDYDAYRRLLELYIELDETLTRRLAQRAFQSTDYDIHEAGEDFLKKLDS